MDSLLPVLIVDEDPVSLKKLERILQGAGYPVSSVHNGVQALHLLRERFSSILITDELELCRQIRKEQFPGYIYVLLLTSKHSKQDIAEGLEAGADQCLMESFTPKRLLAGLKVAERILELESLLKRRNEEIRVLSIQDPLTGAFNRAYLRDELPREIKKFFRYSQSFSLVLCDIDRFKEINDSYGHLAGDFILKKFVNLMEKSIRQGVDWIVRYGGDEFLIILPHTDLTGAGLAAQRLSRELSEEMFVIKGHSLRVTASFGVTSIDLHREDTWITPELLIEEADDGLTQAKRAGGNRIQIHPPQNLPLLPKKSWQPQAVPLAL